MTGLDLVVMGVLAISMLAGLVRGFIREAFSLAAWVLAFVLARMLAPGLAGHITGIEAESLRYLAALLLVFVAVLIGAGLTGKMLSGMVDSAGLGAYDKVLGLGFGTLRGLVFVLMFALLAGLTALPETEVWQGSMVHSPMESAAKMIKPLLPDDLAAHLRY